MEMEVAETVAGWWVVWIAFQVAVPVGWINLEIRNATTTVDMREGC
jgi:hypothetical protein